MKEGKKKASTAFPLKRGNVSFLYENEKGRDSNSEIHLAQHNAGKPFTL